MKAKIKLIVQVLISIPKSFYVNAHFFSLKKAIKLPILVHWRTKLNRLNGAIEFAEISTGIVKIGFSGSFALSERGNCFLDVAGRIRFEGKASFAHSSQIIVNPNGFLQFGNNFRCNTNCIINCSKSISFGEDCLLAWNNSILDTDGHKIIDCLTKEQTNNANDIKVGNHVWLCPNVTILKKTIIPNHCVVATNQVVSKKYNDEYCLIGSSGYLKRNIDWEE